MNYIGLDEKKSEELAEKLNDLLANYSVLYQNVRGYHWNVSGDKFFELHVKFEELYNDLFLKIDEVAERVLTLGFSPNHAYEDYQKTSDIKSATVVNDGVLGVKDILNSFKVIIAKQRDILAFSGDMNDEGTNSQMSDYIREQEKMVWMYSAFLR